MSKLLDGTGLSALWTEIKAKLGNCVTRIFWDSSSEAYMYDTIGKNDLDFPIQEVTTESTRPGLMVAEDKKVINYYKPRHNKYVEVHNTLQPECSANYVSLGVLNDGPDLENNDYQDFSIPAATAKAAGVMTSKDKRIVNYINGSGYLMSAEIKIGSSMHSGELCFATTTLTRNFMPDNDLVFVTPQVALTPIPSATTTHDGVMSASDKKKLDGISFEKDTEAVTPIFTEDSSFVINNVELVLSAMDRNLWCVVFKCSETEDQLYYAMYDGEILSQKQFNYDSFHPNKPLDTLVWFISLPSDATARSCEIVLS